MGFTELLARVAGIIRKERWILTNTVLCDLHQYLFKFKTRLIFTFSELKMWVRLKIEALFFTLRKHQNIVFLSEQNGPAKTAVNFTDRKCLCLQKLSTRTKKILDCQTTGATSYAYRTLDLLVIFRNYLFKRVFLN